MAERRSICQGRHLTTRARILPTKPDAGTDPSMLIASADRLFALLGIRTGSLSPLALINDEARHVRLVIDDELAGEDAFLFHPLDNSASVSLSRSALDTFLAGIDHPADWLPLTAKQSD